MKFSEYIPLAMRTCKELPAIKHANHMAMGVVGEIGEVIDALKKHYIYDKPLDRANLAEEIGDAFWYVAGMVKMLDIAEDSDCLSNPASENLKTLEAKAHVTLISLAINAICAELALSFQRAIIEMVSSDDYFEQGAARFDAMDAAVGIHQELTNLAYLLDVNLEDAFDTNIKKLAKRYGDKYSDFNAINRDLDAERKILEEGV